MTLIWWEFLTLKRSHFVQVVFSHSSTKEQRPSRASLVINVPATGRRRREDDAALSSAPVTTRPGPALTLVNWFFPATQIFLRKVKSCGRRLVCLPNCSPPLRHFAFCLFVRRSRRYDKGLRPRMAGHGAALSIH